MSRNHAVQHQIASIFGIVCLGFIAGNAACSHDDTPPIRKSRVPAYERTLRMPGLEADVRVVKSPGRAYAVLPDGTRVSLPRLWDLNRAAYVQKYGHLVRAFHDHVTALAPGKLASAQIQFRPDLDWNISPRDSALATGMSWRKRARSSKLPSNRRGQRSPRSFPITAQSSAALLTGCLQYSSTLHASYC